MMDANLVKPDDRSDRPSNPLESLVDHIMTPGSTVVSPTFLLMVDITLGSLLFLFLALLVLTWSFHFVALGVITVGLWGSVKLFVEELRKDNEPQGRDAQTSGPSDPSDHPTKSKDN